MVPYVMSAMPRVSVIFIFVVILEFLYRSDELI